MEYNTSELCDTYSDLVDVVEPMFSSFGGRNSFGGTISTIKCFEANGLIRELIKENGVGRVLLIDGGGSLRRALLDAEILAEVFLMMTGGQTSLAFSLDGEQNNQGGGENIQRIVRPSSGLRVVSASDEEIIKRVGGIKS